MQHQPISNPGELVALTGPSGCGKSTLLNLIGALDRPDSGEIHVGGEDVARLADASRYRATTVGFVFQFHNLMTTSTALENVQIPMLGQRARAEREERARGLLAEVGILRLREQIQVVLSPKRRHQKQREHEQQTTPKCREELHRLFITRSPR